MATQPFLWSTVLMGLLVVVVLAAVARRGWRGYSPAAARRRVAAGPTAAPEVDPPTVAGALLAGVAVVLGGAVVAGGPLDADAVQRAAGWVLGLALGGLLVGFLLYGVYDLARYRGLKSAQAAGLGVWVLGLVFVAAVVAVLVMG